MFLELKNKRGLFGETEIKFSLYFLFLLVNIFV